MECVLFEVSALEVIRWDDLASSDGGLSFSMRFVHAGRRRDHRVVRVRGTDVDERQLQEPIYDFCDRVRIVANGIESLCLEFWRGGERIGSHRIKTFEVGHGAA